MSTNHDDPEYLFDRRELMGRLCNDEELLEEVVDVFVEDTPLQIEQIRAAWGRDDGDAISKYGHTIKGASGNVASKQLRAIAYEIEMAGKRFDMNAIPSLLGQMEAVFASFRQRVGR